MSFINLYLKHAETMCGQGSKPERVGKNKTKERLHCHAEVYLSMQRAYFEFQDRGVGLCMRHFVSYLLEDAKTTKPQQWTWCNLPSDAEGFVRLRTPNSSSFFEGNDKELRTRRRQSQKNLTILRLSCKVMEEEKWKGIPGLAVQW